MFPRLPDESRDLDHSTNHIQTWLGLEKLIQSHPEKVKAIGVANYSVKYLEKLLPQATITPAVDQIENHPLLPQQEIVDFCKEKGIVVTAYSPLGSTGSPLFKDESVNEVAKKHSVGPAAVLLSYHSESFYNLVRRSRADPSQLPAGHPPSQSPSHHPASTRTASSFLLMKRICKSSTQSTRPGVSIATYTRRSESMLASLTNLMVWILVGHDLQDIGRRMKRKGECPSSRYILKSRIILGRTRPVRLLA